MSSHPRCAALLLSLGLLTAATACGKKVPSDIKPALEAVRTDARKVADDAAKVCAAQFTSGRYTATPKGCAINLLPGEKVVPVIPSPAVGTSLESNSLVLDVETTCWAPTAPGQACGSNLARLRRPPASGPGAGRARNAVEGNCKSDSTDCEEVLVPSQTAVDEASTDLRIVKPVAGGPAGATVEVTVIFAKK